jgi:hypothetical protein
MEDFVEKAFGEYVDHGTVRSKDESVNVMPKPGSSSHPYLRKIFFRPPKEVARGVTVSDTDLDKIEHKWKIDKETRTIRVKDPNKVVTLLISSDLSKTDSGNDAVAVTFGVTPVATDSRKKEPSKLTAVATGPEIPQDRQKMMGGRVLYVLSHFGKQDSQTDEFALQNLLVNFLVEANERRGTYQPAPPAPKK